MNEEERRDAILAEHIGNETLQFLEQHFVEDLNNWVQWYLMLGGANVEVGQGAFTTIFSWIIETPEGKQFLNKMFRKVSLGRE